MLKQLRLSGESTLNGMDKAALVIAGLLTLPAVAIFSYGIWQWFIAAKAMFGMFKLVKPGASVFDIRATFRVLQVLLSVGALSQDELATGAIFRRALFRFIGCMLAFGMIGLAAQLLSSS